MTVLRLLKLMINKDDLLNSREKLPFKVFCFHIHDRIISIILVITQHVASTYELYKTHPVRTQLTFCYGVSV